MDTRPQLTTVQNQAYWNAWAGMDLSEFDDETLEKVVEVSEFDLYDIVGDSESAIKDRGNIQRGLDKVRLLLTLRQHPEMIMPDVKANYDEDMFTEIRLVTCYKHRQGDFVYVFDYRDKTNSIHWKRHLMSSDGNSIRQYQANLRTSGYLLNCTKDLYAYFVHWFLDDGNFQVAYE